MVPMPSFVVKFDGRNRYWENYGAGEINTDVSFCFSFHVIKPSRKSVSVALLHYRGM